MFVGAVVAVAAVAVAVAVVVAVSVAVVVAVALPLPSLLLVIPAKAGIQCLCCSHQRTDGRDGEPPKTERKGPERADIHRGSGSRLTGHASIESRGNDRNSRRLRLT
jgi:hypothetical protein